MKNRFIVQLLTDFIGGIRDIGHDLSRISYKGVRFRSSDKVFRYGISNLKYRGILRHTRDGVYKLTPKGRVWLRGALLKYHHELGLPWDKKWRVIIFDVPSEMNNARNIFRQRLKSLGFQMIQHSVFVFPYPCEEELGVLCERLKISDYVDILLAESAGSKEEELIRIYDL